MPDKKSYHQQELLTRIIEGDPAAYQQFFETHYAALTFFAKAMVKNGSDAEDIVQEAFIKLWNKRQAIANPEALLSFLYSTARNACIDLIRRETREQTSHQQLQYLLEARELAANSAADSEEVFALVLQQLYEEIDQLPPQCRTIFKMLYLEGLSTTQVAEQLGLSIQTVRNQKTRAIQILKINLGKNPLFLWLFLSSIRLIIKQS